MGVTTQSLNALTAILDKPCRIKRYTGGKNAYGKTSVLSAQSPTGIVYIKIGVTGECVLASEHAGYAACASSYAVPCMPVIAYAPWIKVKSVAALPGACPILIRAASEFKYDDYITVLMTQSCVGVTLSDFIQTRCETEIVRTMLLCAKQIMAMNARGVHHQDMHCCNTFIPDHGPPLVIDFEYSLVRGVPRVGLAAFDTGMIADNISTFPNNRCDLHKFASPTLGVGTPCLATHMILIECSVCNHYIISGEVVKL